MKPGTLRIIIVPCLTLLLTACTKIQDQNIAVSNTGESFATAKRPNVILILGDDIGYEIPTCNGGQSYSTPNIDLLAKQGISYTHCYSMPLCSPSRNELLTGKYNFRNYSIWGQLDTTQRTFANIMKQAGYATCVAGKWQLGGGAASAKKFGFDTHCLFLPFFLSRSDETLENDRRYKNPHIYQNGAYLPDNVTNGKYADDIFTKFICDFIDSNRQKPFFVYYPLSLCHQPFSPPPTNPDFARWDPLKDKSNSKYFPDMVNYMDAKIGEIINKVQADGLASNTMIIYVGDNGTPKGISSKWNDTIIEGAKGSSKVYGIHVPLIITYLGNKMRAGAIANTLIDFSDFLPTLASIANTRVTASYGTVDGVSFYQSITGARDSIRSSVFFHWQDSILNDYERWAQTSTYKLYDATNHSSFYNFAIDPLEQKPIPSSQRTPEQKSIATMLKNVLDSLHP